MKQPPGSRTTLNVRVAALCSLLVVGTVFAHPHAQTAPSLLIVNARVFTGVASQPWTDAIAIAGDRIVATGTTAALQSTATTATRVIDAKGAVVIPGVNDAHVHLGAGPDATSLEGPPAMTQDPSLDDIVARLKIARAKARESDWILGEIGERVLDDPGATRTALDAVVRDRPVLLTAWTGHGSLFNTAALRRLNVREDEPDPPGGFFVRDQATRVITGVAHEYAGYMLWRRLAAIAGEKALVDALRSFSKTALSFGITSIQAMLTAQTTDEIARALAIAAVPVRIRLIDFPMSAMGDWHQPQRRAPIVGQTKASGTKWILDGTPVERLMFLREPYTDRPSTRGRLNFSSSAIASFLRTALASREQPMFHAGGDAAIAAVLDALEATGAERWQPLRPRIEHGDMIEPSQFGRARKLGVIVVQNPAHFMLPDLMAARLGRRKDRMTMMKSLQAARVPVALGSDGPLNPFLNLMFAVTNANNPREAMTREQVILAYTSGSAYAEFEETQKGTLASGQLADLAMLSQDIFTVPVDKLPATQSVLTVVGGRVVHEVK